MLHVIILAAAHMGALQWPFRIGPQTAVSAVHLNMLARMEDALLHGSWHVWVLGLRMLRVYINK